MFDVAWTDPTVETNAQRRQRKEREETKEGSRRSSVKSASSSGASTKAQPTSRKGWGLFGNSKKPSSSGTVASSTTKSSLGFSTKDESSRSAKAAAVLGDDFMSSRRSNNTDQYDDFEPASPGATSRFSGSICLSRLLIGSYFKLFLWRVNLLWRSLPLYRYRIFLERISIWV